MIILLLMASNRRVNGGTITDPIVEEVRKARNKHAKKFNYDVKEVAADIQKQQKESGREFVSFPAKRIEPVFSKRLLSKDSHSAS